MSIATGRTSSAFRLGVPLAFAALLGTAWRAQAADLPWQELGWNRLAEPRFSVPAPYTPCKAIGPLEPTSSRLLAEPACTVELAALLRSSAQTATVS